MSAPGDDRPAVKSISFVVPAFNESECVEELISQTTGTLDRLGIDGDVVIVDDASTDDTGDKVRAAAQRDGRVRLIRSEDNIGPQLCIARALLQTTTDAAFAIPCDLQVRADELAHCLGPLEHADLVMTDRRPRAEGMARRAMADSFNFVVRRTVGVPVHDIDSSFLIRRRLIDDVVPALQSRSDFLQAELVARAAAAGYTIVEEPVRHYERPAGRATAITPRLVVRTVTDLARLAGQLRRLQTRPATQ